MTNSHLACTPTQFSNELALVLKLKALLRMRIKPIKWIQN
jgi:hypothetical protein